MISTTSHKARAVFIQNQPIESQEFWESWDLLANEIIPKDYEFTEAFRDALMPPEDFINEGCIIEEMESIFNYPTWARQRCITGQVYWLDWLIRQYLGKDPRP